MTEDKEKTDNITKEIELMEYSNTESREMIEAKSRYTWGQAAAEVESLDWCAND